MLSSDKQWERKKNVEQIKGDLECRGGCSVAVLEWSGQVSLRIKIWAKTCRREGGSQEAVTGQDCSKTREEVKPLRHKALDGFKEQLGGKGAGGKWGKKQGRSLELKGVKTDCEVLCRPSSIFWYLLWTKQEPWQDFKQSDRTWLLF